ncbi:MAG TPA: hypothetical protein VLT33_50295, partial [Labilithrix sp.]|nr:hypothetical protein [Labilithrix sp.]
MSPRKLALAAAGALALAASWRVARADDPLPVHIDYERRPGCPEEDAFTREVLSRVSRARTAATGERARSLVVRVRSAEHGLEASLVVRELDGTTAQRSVRGASCAELVTALAVIAAVVI